MTSLTHYLSAPQVKGRLRKELEGVSERAAQDVHFLHEQFSALSRRCCASEELTISLQRRVAQEEVPLTQLHAPLHRLRCTSQPACRVAGAISAAGSTARG